jgi:probable phosphoglycerate mutase
LLVTSNGAARFALLAAGLEAQAGMKLPTGGFGVIVPEPGGLRLACWGRP